MSKFKVGDYVDSVDILVTGRITEIVEHNGKAFYKIQWLNDQDIYDESEIQLEEPYEGN